MVVPAVPAVAATDSGYQVVRGSATTAHPSRATGKRHATHPTPARRRVVLSPAARAKWSRGADAPARHEAAAKVRITVHSTAPAAGLAPHRQAAASFTPPFNQCPAVGYDESCGILVNITSGQLQILADSSQGPYDGSDDTLIGVVNSSTQRVDSFALSSGTDIFGFDGDGICSGFTPAPPDCPFGPTGYEGPGTSFTGINSAGTGGTVNFSGGIAP
ncbi:MAG TPA: hypothetical protein VGL02_04150, partial [Streptomyces sp.]